MNQRFIGGLTAALVVASLGQVLPMQASELLSNDDQPGSEGASQTDSLHADSSNDASDGTSSEASVVKVGEYRSQEQVDDAENSVAAIHAHRIDNRRAATLYVRDIPVLTVMDSTVSAAEQSEVVVSQSPSEQAKVGQSASAAGGQPSTTAALDDGDDASVEENYAQDPVWRATAIAARLNQAHRNQVDPSTITAHWDSEREMYVLRLGDDLLVSLDSRVRLPDTTGDDAEDILQMANRIRRQLGAEPLANVEGRPEPARQVAAGSVRFQFSGMASWYGPGFHGRRSASGEIFNQHALTAAHPSLPFGTLLQVTNAHTGRTVTVRVNDRGPYSGRRVIDLSAAAARAIGMIQLGVAPVRVQVLSGTDAAN